MARCAEHRRASHSCHAQAPAERSRWAEAPGRRRARLVIEAQLAARLREQMHRWRPAAATSAADRRRYAGVAQCSAVSRRRRARSLILQPTARADRLGAGAGSAVLPRGLVRHHWTLSAPHVERSRRSRRRLRVQRERRARRCRRSSQRRPRAAGLHAVALQIGARGAASMMPGRSLSGNTSGRSIAPSPSTTSLRAHLPQPLARQVGDREAR